MDGGRHNWARNQQRLWHGATTCRIWCRVCYRSAVAVAVVIRDFVCQEATQPPPFLLVAAANAQNPMRLCHQPSLFRCCDCCCCSGIVLNRRNRLRGIVPCNSDHAKKNKPPVCHRDDICNWMGWNRVEAMGSKEVERGLACWWFRRAISQSNFGVLLYRCAKAFQVNGVRRHRKDFSQIKAQK